MFLHHNSHSTNHWHILGAGAIGTLWAGALVQKSIPATLLVRPERLAGQHQSTLLTIEYPLKKETVPISLESTTTRGHAAHPIHQLLVTTKAGDTLAALALLRERLTPDTIIVLLQNGMGHQQKIVEAFPDCAIYAGSTTDGVWQQAFLHVHLMGEGLTHFGALNEAAHRQESRMRLQPLLSLDTPKAQECDNIVDVLQQKLAINASINGLTVLYDCPNGGLLKPEIQPHVARLCQETETILASEGFDSKTSLLKLINRILTITANNISSSLQDARNGRPTELAYINGYLIECAIRNGIPATAHQQLLQDLKRLENRKI